MVEVRKKKTLALHVVFLKVIHTRCLECLDQCSHDRVLDRKILHAKDALERYDQRKIIFAAGVVKTDLFEARAWKKLCFFLGLYYNFHVFVYVPCCWAEYDDFSLPINRSYLRSCAWLHWSWQLGFLFYKWVFLFILKWFLTLEIVENRQSSSKKLRPILNNNEGSEDTMGIRCTLLKGSAQA